MTKNLVDVDIIEVKTKNTDMMITETKNLVDIATSMKITTPDIGIIVLDLVNPLAPQKRGFLLQNARFETL
jgi:subtilisin-like proprotein convertase family protein